MDFTGVVYFLRHLWRFYRSKQMNADEIRTRISRLKRSPRLGGIFELYRSETEQTLKKTTQEKHLKIWFTHFGELENVRADRLSPLELQKRLLDEQFKAGHYHTVNYLARFVCAMLDFAVAVGILKVNPVTSIFSLPLLKKSRSMEAALGTHRPTLPYTRLRSELKQVITVFEEKASLRRRLLLEISLRTILRPGECVKLLKDNLSITEHTLKVVNTKTKTVFIIPTSASLEQAILLAGELFGGGKEDYVFAGVRNPSGHLSAQVLNCALKDYGYENRLCAHGIRSVAANYFASVSTKVLPHIASACLQHAVGSSVEKCYRRDDFLRDRRRAMKLWNEWLDGIYEEVRLKMAS